MTKVIDFLERNAPRITLLMIPLVSAAMHWRVFQMDLVGQHVWRQTQTQTVIVNFYEEDFNILNPRQNNRGSGDGIRRMEFPLMQWTMACFYKVFGNHLIITRILSFVLGIFSVWGMYFLLNALFKKRLAAMAGAWAFNFSPAFFYHTLNPMPDNFALCFGIWGLAFFFNWHDQRKKGFLWLAGFFLSVAALCKLPFVIYFSIPLLHFTLNFLHKKDLDALFGQLLTIALSLLPPAIWYAWVIPTWRGTGIVQGILGGETPASQLLQYLFGNLTSTLPELLLNYASLPFFLAGLYFLYVRKAYRDTRFPLLATLGLIVVGYFLFELNMIGNEHDYYFFPFMPLLFILVGYGILQCLDRERGLLRACALSLLLLMPLTAHLRTRNSWNAESPGFNKDWLVYKEILQTVVPDNALCVVGNDVSYQIFFYEIEKKGWAFTDNRLDAPALSGMIREGAQYLYSDTRQVDEDTRIRPFLDTLVLEKGSVRVFRLRQ